ncbi:Thiol protease [Symbiodinium microadriaticum]|uniref:Thiol protease n=1 Tax=Symbiodinium microadriaticum TaxID=2951 RepID=A0A1Q9E5S7_SYMMI|nr:Thiol protease [Symbiodinium microadriaticum]
MLGTSISWSWSYILEDLVQGKVFTHEDIEKGLGSLIGSFAAVPREIFRDPHKQNSPLAAESSWWGSRDASASDSKAYIGGWLAMDPNPDKSSVSPKQRIAVLEMLGSLVLMAFLIEKNDQGKRFLIIPLLSDKGTCPSSPRSVQGVMAWLRAIYPPQGLPSPEHLQEKLVCLVCEEQRSINMFQSFRILAFLACAASLRGEREKFTSEEDDEAAYKQFRQEFNRTADDSIAYMERLAHFRRFRNAVARHNARTDASWRAVVGPFADYTDAEFKALLGHRRTFRPEVKTASSFLQTEPHKTVASTVDWTDKLSSVRSVKGMVWFLGARFVFCSCWAVAAIGALEMHAELALQKASSALSSNQVKDCSTNPKHCGGSGGCQGSTSELAYDYIVKNGIALDSTYGGDKNRDSSCQPHKPYLRIAGFQPLPVNKLQPLMEAVSTKGPVVVSIDASGWNSYGGGIFDSCDKDAVVNHAVVLVGYGKSKSENKEYWLIRNSWGEGWGEKGFIRLLRHSSDQGDAGYCGTDRNPKEGVGCDGGPPEIPVCGMCGVLSDSVYPTGLQLA